MAVCGSSKCTPETHNATLCASNDCSTRVPRSLACEGALCGRHRCRYCLLATGEHRLVGDHTHTCDVCGDEKTIVHSLRSPDHTHRMVVCSDCRCWCNGYVYHPRSLDCRRLCKYPTCTKCANGSQSCLEHRCWGWNGKRCTNYGSEGPRVLYDGTELHYCTDCFGECHKTGCHASAVESGKFCSRHTCRTKDCFNLRESRVWTGKVVWDDDGESGPRYPEDGRPWSKKIWENCIFECRTCLVEGGLDPKYLSGGKKGYY